MREATAAMKLRPYPVWPAFVMIIVLFGVDIKEASDEMTVNLLTHVNGTIPHSDLYWILSFFIGVYYLMCVYRFHSVLRRQSSGAYSVKPSQAAFFHLIPVFNIYWLFAWPHRFTTYVAASHSVKVASGAVCGFWLLASLIAACFLNWGVGMFGMFVVAAYLTNRLRHYVGFLERERAAVPAQTPA